MVEGPPRASSRRVGARVPLTQRQTLFWIERQLDPLVPAHNVAAVLTIEGELDVRRFQLAFEALVQEIEALRLFVDGDRPEQWIADAAPPALEIVDLEASGGLRELVTARTYEPFAFPGWLFRGVLARTGPQSHAFCMVVHHIIFDGASLLACLLELSHLYAGEPAKARAPFLEYVEFERTYRTSRKGARDSEYWANKLGRGGPPLRFYGSPAEKPGLTVDRRWHAGGRDRAERLAAICTSDPFELPTLHMSRLVALAVVLAAYVSRVTDGREILIATPIPNRTSHFADTCGLLMEETFLKVTVDPEDTFRALGEKVRRDLLATLRHGQYCVSERGLDFVSLNLLPQSFDRFAGLPCHLTLIPAVTLEGNLSASREPPSRFGFGVHDFEGSDGLKLAVDFNTATFPSIRRERAFQHAVRVLDALLEDLDTRIAAVDLNADEERASILSLSWGRRVDEPADDVTERVARLAREDPDRLAVVVPEGHVTYGELERLTIELAKRLAHAGVERTSRVGVSLPRGLTELVTLLAILKVGAAYVPLDPSHPPERIALMIEDQPLSLLVTKKGMPLAEGGSHRVLLLEGLADATRMEGSAPSFPRAAPEDLAYVLFTSGSTGRPKGVEVPRGALANFLRSMAREPGFARHERLLAITTTMFDIAGLELFLPLWVGGVVQLAEREVALDPRQLRGVLERDPIDVMQATPATWRLLVESGWKGNGRLRMLCGGEALSSDLAAALLERGGELHNLYGPTETTVWSTHQRIERGVGRILVGRPIDNTKVVVLDAGGHVAPFGVSGELCIGGAGVARGYGGRPDLTAERFVRDPYESAPQRLYRTGDLARLLEGGELECLGRIDSQVKIRGFRVELEEVEAVLRRTEQVLDVAVLAQTDGGETRLIVYYRGDAEDSALADIARSRLPQYMRPSAYVKLQVLPLNANGKVDRKALPAVSDFRPASVESVELPRNDDEARVAAIWRDLLRVAEVSVNQDFYSLGGTSPLAIAARDRIETELQRKLPLRAMFDAPTVERVVRALGSPESPDQPVVVTLRPQTKDEPPLFLLLGIHLYQDLAAALPSGPAVIGMHVPVLLVPGSAKIPTVKEIGAQYVDLIVARQAHGPYRIGGLCFGGIVAFEAAAQLVARGETVELVALLDTQLPRALEFDRVARVRGFATRAVTDPGYLRELARQRLERAVSHWYEPMRGRLRRAATRSSTPIELGVDGPEAEALVAEYDSRVAPVDTHAVIIRALDRGLPLGARLDPSLGWSTLATRCSSHGVRGDHLEILRPPNVEDAAAFLGRFLVAS